MQNDKNDESVIRLYEKKKRGLLRFLFSRAGFMIGLILIQLVPFLIGYYYLSENYKVPTMYARTVFTIIMTFYLFNCKMDYSAKLTWMLMISLFPLATSVVLLFSKTGLIHLGLKRRLSKMIDDTKHQLKQDPLTFIDPELEESGTNDLCFYLNRSGCFPIYSHTEVKFFPLGEYKFKAMLEELRKAESFIFLEYFIIDEGYMWGSILKILADKAAEGVDVRVMYDGMCEVSTLPGNYPARLAKLGIKCKPFSPIKPFVSTHYNYRDHRKILVIDGKVGFNGGVNLADEYINHIVRFGHWKDTAVMLKGDAVNSFTLMFLQMWNADELQPEWDKFLQPDIKAEHDGFVMPYCDQPLGGSKVGEQVYIDILNRARSYVHIMTPYLILDNELEQALVYAAQRGIDVKIIVPGIPDKKGAYSLAKSHYRSLTDAGVKVYEYVPGFVHAKVFVSDNEKAVIGTINLDYRSLYHHFECATYMYKCACVADIEEDYKKTLTACRQVTSETIRDEKIAYRIMAMFMKLLAPLL